MFVVNEDLSIYATRGDIVCLNVSATDDRTGEAYEFQPGDILQMKIYRKKNAEDVLLQKDFPVPAKTNTVGVFLTEQDTKIGNVISKPTDYWYEVTLNPYTNPQTFIGYDDDGAKIFRLFPEGNEVDDEEEIAPEDIPIVDTDLSLLSSRPVENKAIARAITLLKNDMTMMDSRLTGKIKENKKSGETVAEELAVERARIDNLVSGATADDSEVIDIRVGADGVTYDSAGTAVREQFGTLTNHIEAIQNGDKYCNVTEINQHYYKTSRALNSKGRYLIRVTSDAEFTCTEVQAGTSSEVSAMVDTIATSVGFVAGVAKEFYYEPSEDGLSVLCVRNPGDHTLTVEVDRVVTANDVFGVHNAVDCVTPQMFGAVGDGVTDDTNAINSAIEYAYNNGIKNVVIPKSEDCYIITMIVLKEGIRLLGNGGELKVADNYAVDNSENYYVIYSDADNVTLENLVVFGNSKNNVAFNVCDTITVLGDNVTIKNCKLYDAIDSAIMFSRCTHSFCTDNYINGARDLGIYINDGGDGTGCVDNVISKNIIDGCANGGIALKRTCQRNLVSDNVISNTSQDGASGIAVVHVDTDTDHSYNNTIVNNRIYSVDNGLYLDGTNCNIISGNRVEFFREKGIVITGVCSDNAITGNVVSQRTDAVLPTSNYNGGIIFVNNNGGESSRNTISGNIVKTKHNPALSCYTTYSKTSVIDKNSITGNVFESVNSFGAYAFDALQNNVIAANIFVSDREPYVTGANTVSNNVGL